MTPDDPGFNPVTTITLKQGRGLHAPWFGYVAGDGIPEEDEAKYGTGPVLELVSYLLSRQVRALAERVVELEELVAVMDKSLRAERT